MTLDQFALLLGSGPEAVKIPLAMLVVLHYWPPSLRKTNVYDSAKTG